MRTIYKFPLAVTDEQQIEMPRGSRFLGVETQGGVLYLWAIVETENPRYRHAFYVVGTGNPLPVDAVESTYLGTVDEGPFVWHVFDGGPA